MDNSSEYLLTNYNGELLEVKSLPTLPSVLEEMNQLLHNPDISPEQVADLLVKDQVLSSRLLKVVNSPIYNFPGKISSMQHALVLLGFNVVHGLLLSTNIFENLPPGMNKLWDHSMAVSLAAAEIARTLNFKDPGEFAVAGLLHDIGKVVIEDQLPGAANEIRTLVKNEDLTVRQAEEKVLGFSHEKINGWLANAWRLPPVLAEGITYHHCPPEATTYPLQAACVQLGDFLARVFQQGSGGDNQAPEVCPQTFKVLGIDKKNLITILDRVGEKFSEVSGYFL